MRELEKYMQELTQDIVEMIGDASPEEKQYLEKTQMLNFDVESIQTLIKNRKWIELNEYNKIGAIYQSLMICGINYYSILIFYF